MDAYAHLRGPHIRTGLGPLPSRQIALHVQSRQHRTLRMILLRYGSAKDDQDAIPACSTNYTPVPLGDMVGQLEQRMQPALPGLQAALRPLHGGGYQRATQDSDDFPLIDWGCVRHR